MRPARGSQQPLTGTERRRYWSEGRVDRQQSVVVAKICFAAPRLIYSWADDRLCDAVSGSSLSADWNGLTGVFWCAREMDSDTGFMLPRPLHMQ